MQPKVSVIIPVYNQEKYLADTIDSVLAQTFQDYEIVIVDDGSKDNSVAIIQRYADKYAHIIPVFQANTGKPQAISAAVEKAQGELIAFLDHDDLMMPERLEKQVAFHQQNPAVDASSSHSYHIDDKGKVIGLEMFPFLKTVEESKKLWKSSEFIICAFSALMISKKVFIAVGGLRSQFWPCDDADFFHRLVENGYVLLIIQDILMKYRIHNNSISVSNHWHMLDMLAYTHHCITLRRNNQPEVSFHDFILTQKQEPWWIKMNRKRFNYSVYFHRKANLSFHSKKYYAFTKQIIVTTLLNPSFVYQTILNRIMRYTRISRMSTT